MPRAAPAGPEDDVGEVLERVARVEGQHEARDLALGVDVRHVERLQHLCGVKWRATGAYKVSWYPGVPPLCACISGPIMDKVVMQTRFVAVPVRALLTYGSGPRS